MVKIAHVAVVTPRRCGLEGCDNKYHARGLCQKHYARKYFDRKQSYKEYDAARYRKRYEQRISEHKLWQGENLDKCREYNKKSYHKNIEASRQRCKVNAANRRAAKLQRTPKWSDKRAVRQFYESCPKGYEVDHVIPLQGEAVSGLHVVDNLQYLPASDNRSKGNNYEQT